MDGSEKDRSAFAMGAAAAVANGSITNRPAFSVGDALELMNPNATEEEVFLALAKHVPALSSPVGGMRLWNEEGKNINMNLDSDRGGIPRPNGWGRNADSYYRLNWLHSDMKDVAYFYVYKLYEQLVQKGTLQ